MHPTGARHAAVSAAAAGGSKKHVLGGGGRSRRITTATTITIQPHKLDCPKSAAQSLLSVRRVLWQHLLTCGNTFLNNNNSNTKSIIVGYLQYPSSIITTPTTKTRVRIRAKARQPNYWLLWAITILHLSGPCCVKTVQIVGPETVRKLICHTMGRGPDHVRMTKVNW